MKRILVACEQSQVVTTAFRKQGYDAWSCDIQPCSGDLPEYHLQCNVLDILQDNWHMMIAHPPCTYLTIAANKWDHHPEDKHLPMFARRPHPKFPNRQRDRQLALEFFKQLYNAPIKYIAIENPLGVVGRLFKQHTQIIQPYQFGDDATKRTCLWLKNLTKLVPTNVVPVTYHTYNNGRKTSAWLHKTLQAKPKDRAKLRSVTFNGIAEAMVNQWGILI